MKIRKLILILALYTLLAGHCFALALASVQNVSLSGLDDEPQLQKEPDTLSMTFPKQVSWLVTLKDSLQILVDCEGDPVSMALAEDPIVTSTDPFNVKFIVESIPESFDPNGNYCLVNPNMSSGNIVYANLFNTLAGVDINAPATMNILGNYEGGGALNNVTKVRNTNGGYDYQRKWIPPRFFTSRKTINTFAQQNCTGQSEVSGYVNYSDECLSSIQVVSKGAYQARIQVYDNTGKFVHGSVQSFGKCGELDNDERELDNGKVSWLVWNMEDSEQNPVSNGVYIWKVQFVSEDNSQPFTAIYKQGVARNAAVNSCGERL